MNKVIQKFRTNPLLILPVILLGFFFLAFSSRFWTTSEISETTNPETKTLGSVICDGIVITKNCTYENVEYEIYQYYAAQEEVSHIETKTIYTKEISGYCTLCKDGTYSPSCATGRGACSHHGGVAKWNAPIYKDVPKIERVKVIDREQSPERYEKIIKKTN